MLSTSRQAARLGFGLGLGLESEPVLDARGVVKAYGGLRPFRLRELRVARGEVVALSGPDAAQASVLVDLLTGATLPDEGEVVVRGRSTRAIEGHEDWLAFLEGFGLVGERVVLLQGLTVAQNLAIPLTLSVDPMEPSVRQSVERLAVEAGLSPGLLDSPLSQAGAAVRARIRLGRAVAHDPSVLLLEHPTAGLERPEAEAYGSDVRRLAARRGLAALLVTADAALAREATRALEWRAATGQLSRAGGRLRRLLGS